MLFRCKPLRKAVKSEVSCKKVLVFVTRCRASQFYLCTAAFSSCKSTAPGIKTLPSVYCMWIYTKGIQGNGSAKTQPLNNFHKHPQLSHTGKPQHTHTELIITERKNILSFYSVGHLVLWPRKWLKRTHLYLYLYL